MTRVPLIALLFSCIACAEQDNAALRPTPVLESGAYACRDIEAELSALPDDSNERAALERKLADNNCPNAVKTESILEEKL